MRKTNTYVIQKHWPLHPTWRKKSQFHVWYLHRQLYTHTAVKFTQLSLRDVINTFCFKGSIHFLIIPLFQTKLQIELSLQSPIRNILWQKVCTGIYSNVTQWMTVQHYYKQQHKNTIGGMFLNWLKNKKIFWKQRENIIFIFLFLKNWFIAVFFFNSKVHTT